MVKMKKNVLNVIIVALVLTGILSILTGCGKDRYENITVYINDGMSENKISDLEDKLKEIEGVNSVEYTSKAQAFEEAKEKIRR